MIAIANFLFQNSTGFVGNGARTFYPRARTQGTFALWAKSNISHFYHFINHFHSYDEFIMPVTIPPQTISF